jgi:hypothetical protein
VDVGRRKRLPHPLFRTSIKNINLGKKYVKKSFYVLLISPNGPSIVKNLLLEDIQHTLK